MSNLRAHSFGFGAVCGFMVGCVLAQIAHGAEPRAEPGELPSRTVSVSVDLDRVAGSANPFVYGQMVEHAYWAVHLGLANQMIDNGGFEPDTDNAHPDVAQHWKLVSTEPRNAFAGSLSRLNPHKGDSSQKIAVSTFAGGEVRLLQPGLHVQRGTAYSGSAFLRGAPSGSVRVVLLSGSGRELASQSLPAGDAVWRRVDFSLTPTETSVDAALAIALAGEGELEIDHLRMAPSGPGHEHGMRNDILELYRQLRPPFVRWPGGTYLVWHQWKNGIGPQDERPQTVGRRVSAPGHDQEWDTNLFGSDEFLRFCAEIGAEPIVNVNIKDGLQNALDWIEYTNGTPDTEWGSRRQKNGRREPWGVKYWVIDNEPSVRTQDKGYTLATYPGLTRKFAEAIKQKDPSINLLVMGETGFVPRMTKPTPELTLRVLQESGGVMDQLCIHNYYRNPDLQGMPYRMGEALGILKKTIDVTTGRRDIKVAVTEWNTLSHTSQAGTLAQAVEAAQWFHVLERASAAGVVGAAAPCQLAINAGRYRGEWLKAALIQFNNHAAWVSPLYHVNGLYSRLRQPVLLDITTSGIPEKQSKTYKGFSLPALDVVASRDESRRRVVVKLVHNAEDEDYVLRMNLRSARAIKAAKVTEIRADSLKAMNTESSPATVVPLERSIPVVGTQLEYRLQPHTVAALELDVE